MIRDSSSNKGSRQSTAKHSQAKKPVAVISIASSEEEDVPVRSRTRKSVGEIDQKPRIPEVEIDESPENEISLDQRNYQLTYELLPEAEPMEFWTVAFSLIYKSLFCALQANKIFIFELKESGFKTYAVIEEKERAEEELFYAATWSGVSSPLLAAGGKTGRILVFELKATEVSTKHTLLGHGAEVNDLKTHPSRTGIILSASGDFSIRMWNAFSGVCIAVFGGHRGHRDEVNAVSFSLSSPKMVSAGADNRICIWDLNAVAPQIAASFKAQDQSVTSRATQPRLEQFPEFSTNLIHETAVDDVAFVGDLILSKGTDERVVCWKPIYGSKGIAAPLLSLACSGNRKTWMRFGLDSNARIVAVGNDLSQILLWDLENVDLTKEIRERHKPHKILSVLKSDLPKGKRKISDDNVITKIAFNWDGSTFIVSTIGGVLRRYDDIKTVPAPENTATT